MSSGSQLASADRVLPWGDGWRVEIHRASWLIVQENAVVPLIRGMRQMKDCVADYSLFHREWDLDPRLRGVRLEPKLSPASHPP